MYLRMCDSFSLQETMFHKEVDLNVKVRYKEVDVGVDASMGALVTEQDYGFFRRQ